MVAIPVFKLFQMTIKTVTKPIANRIKSEASRHPTLRRGLEWMGQSSHQLSSKLSINAAGHTATKIKPLDEAAAVARGGTYVAEGFIYAVGGGLVIWDYRTNQLKAAVKGEEAKKAKEEDDRKQAAAFQAIDHRLRVLEAEILQHSLEEIQETQSKMPKLSKTSKTINSNTGWHPTSRASGGHQEEQVLGTASTQSTTSSVTAHRGWGWLWSLFGSRGSKIERDKGDEKNNEKVGELGEFKGKMQQAEGRCRDDREEGIVRNVGGRIP
ncbi:unnamed protein product [Discosporangium mesarthrocarpum]